MAIDDGIITITSTPLSATSFYSAYTGNADNIIAGTTIGDWSLTHGSGGSTSMQHTDDLTLATDINI